MRDNKNIRRERRLEHDRHVGRVEQLDGVRSSLAPEAVRLHRDLEAESLQIDDDGKHGDGRNEVHDIGQALAPERLAECAAFVIPGEKKVEQRHDRALEFGPAASIDGGRGECLPYNRLTDVGRDEERDTGSEPVALLEELIEEDDDEGGRDELNDEEQAYAGTEVAGLTIETGEDIDSGLTERDDEGEY